MFSYDADGRLQVIAEDWGWYTNTCEWQAGEVSLGGSEFFSLDGELVTTAPGGGRYGELHFSYDSDGKTPKGEAGQWVLCTLLLGGRQAGEAGRRR